MTGVTTEFIQTPEGPVETLVELLRPGLRAVVVGINPSLPSVRVGHYYQGRLGRRLWGWLEEAAVVRDLPPGAQDDAAFDQGLGFADLVRQPSANARHLKRPELSAAVPDLAERLRHAGVAPPTCLVFAYVASYEAAAPILRAAGYDVVRLPGFYAPREEVLAALRAVPAERSDPPGRRGLGGRPG